jgi:hypothetical protein
LVRGSRSFLLHPVLGRRLDQRIVQHQFLPDFHLRLAHDLSSLVDRMSAAPQHAPASRHVLLRPSPLGFRELPLVLPTPGDAVAMSLIVAPRPIVTHRLNHALPAAFLSAYTASLQRVPLAFLLCPWRFRRTAKFRSAGRTLRLTVRSNRSHAFHLKASPFLVGIWRYFS